MKEMKRLKSLHFGGQSRKNSKASKEASKKHLTNDQPSEDSSDSEEQDLDNNENEQILKEIHKLMGCDVDVQPNSVDLDTMRKLVHTPKDGVLLPQDTKYYIANLRQNEFLRKFINDYDAGL